MPLFEDNKYHFPFIGNIHPVKIMDGNKVIYEPKTLEQSGTSLTFNNTYNDFVDRLEIEGKTQETYINRWKGNYLKFIGWSTYQTSQVTLTQNISVPEWGTNEATRIQITGGAGNLKYYLGGVGGATVGKTLIASIYIKNLKAIPFVFKMSGTGFSQTIEPNETRFVYAEVPMTSTNPLMQFATINITDELDFIAWQPFISTEKMTNYPISLDSVNDFNLTVAGVNINFPYTLRSLPNGVCDKLVVDKTTPIPSAWIERKVQFYEDADSRTDWGYEINEIEHIPYQDIVTHYGTTIITTDSGLQPNITAKVKIIDT